MHYSISALFTLVSSFTMQSGSDLHLHNLPCMLGNQLPSQILVAGRPEDLD